MLTRISKKILRLLKKVLTQSFFKNVLTVGLVTLLIKGLGFYKELVIAENYGLSELLDTFLIALLIPGFISAVFLNSYKNVFIPNYVTELKQNGNVKAFQTSSFLITIGVGLFFILIAYLFTDVYLETFFSGHTASYYALVKTQLYYLLPCILFWAVSSLLTGLLNIDNEYFYSSMSSLFISLSIMVCLWFFKDVLQEKVLAIAMLVGSFIDMLFMLAFSIKRGIIFIGTPNFSSKNMRLLLTQAPAKVSSSLISGLNTVVDQFFSAQLVIGSISALNYGLKIPAFVIGLIGVSLGSVILPYFSKYAVDSHKETFDRLQRLLKYNLVACVLFAAFLIIFSHPIVSLVFERDAFTADDTNIVYKVQQMYLLQIPFYVTGVIMIQYLTAINKNNFLVVTSIISLLLNIVLNIVLIRILGILGLALATSLVSFLNSAIIYYYIITLNKKRYV